MNFARRSAIKAVELIARPADPVGPRLDVAKSRVIPEITFTSSIDPPIADIISTVEFTIASACGAMCRSMDDIFSFILKTTTPSPKNTTMEIVSAITTANCVILDCLA